MESGIQSSFIPHDAATPTRPRSSGTGGLSELVFLVSIVLLVASGALAGAVFLYQQYTASSSESKVQALKRAKDAFKPQTINELTRLDDRMQAAGKVLTAHIAPLALFDALQISTLVTVSFESLSLEVVDSQNISLKMEGVAQGVNSIALQADLFSKSGVLTNPIFSDISRQVDGVHFNLVALVNPAAINYASLLSAGVPTLPQNTGQGEDAFFNGAQSTGAPASGAAQEAGDGFTE